LTDIGGYNQDVIVDLVLGAHHEHISGNPMYVKNNSERALSPSSSVNNISPQKLISANDVKNVFLGGISSFGNVSVDHNSVTCDNCNSYP
jgi:hypothetical protein